MTFRDGSVYTGEFLNGLKYGHGTYTWANGDKYFGQFIGGDVTGFGLKFFNKDNSQESDLSVSYYEGNLLNDSPHGKGFVYYSNGERAECEYCAGKIRGLFVRYSKSGQVICSTEKKD